MRQTGPPGLVAQDNAPCVLTAIVAAVVLILPPAIFTKPLEAPSALSVGLYPQHHTEPKVTPTKQRAARELTLHGRFAISRPEIAAVR